MEIFDPKNDKIYYNAGDTYNMHMFETREGGSFKSCFQNNAPDNVQFEFHLRTGLDANDYSQVVTQKDIEIVQREANRVLDISLDLKKTMKFVGKEEKKLVEQSDTVNTRVYTFAGVTVGFMLFATILSSCYLNVYIKKKKDK